ncbi:MAG TPA: hypothetical protein VEJ88_08425, partial [Dissulfurispiraceae bacterium]|nr:hypothetical protein [Dissulfurispiraceae bacterium]
WDAAASLSEQYPVSKISKLLSLHHTKLRDRVASYGQGNGSKSKEPAFIELDMSSSHAASAECTIEMEKPGGAKMKITIKGNCPDIAVISKAFLG